MPHRKIFRINKQNCKKNESLIDKGEPTVPVIGFRTFNVPAHHSGCMAPMRGKSLAASRSFYVESGNGQKYYFNEYRQQIKE